MKKPTIILKIFNKNGKPVRMVRTNKRGRILSNLQTKKWKNHTFLLRVIYNSNKGFINEGEYKTKKDLMFALRCFTKPDLVKEFMKVEK